MAWDIHIDPSNGHVCCGATVIGPETKLEQLNGEFQLGEPFVVSGRRAQVSCSFATTHGHQDGLDFEVSLRFEARVLVSVFIRITDPTLPTATLDEFYASREPLQRLHGDWLRSQVGDARTELTNYAWGSVGVARDKSDGIHVFVHYRGGT